MTVHIMNLFKSYCTFIGAFNAKNYKASDLQIVMYVLLSDEWFKHSFLKNQFKIKSEKQIKKIIDGGIADVYDALTSERTYRAKLDPFRALELMKEEMITHFSKEIFDEFVLLFK